jgi:hypothetical protein
VLLNHLLQENSLKEDKKFELAELKDIDTNEDPVRPELNLDFRTSHGRKIYGIKDDNGEIAAVMCFAFTNEVPVSVSDMDILSKDAALQAVYKAGQQGSIAVAYTVWARKKGGGKHIVNEVYKMIKQSSHLNRLVTLSPLTAMAERFHLKNGAKLLQVNDDTQNFEYDIELEQWEKFLARVRKIKDKIPFLK